jgi:putative membrane protein
MTNTVTSFFQTLGAGLWVLVPQLAVTLVLLAIGVAVYLWITRFDERGMVERGNLAGGVTLGGAVLALSIPLAATLATSHSIIGIAVWGGSRPHLLQLLAFAVATMLLHGLRRNIEAGNVAAAVTLIGISIAVALVNAAAVAG